MRYRFGDAIDLDDYSRAVGDADPFVIDGVLHRSTTLIYGQTMAGKSTVSASIARAISGQASDWLGRPVTTHGHVLIVAGDPDGGREYASRIGRWPDITVYAPNRPGIPNTWAEVAACVTDRKSALVVIDNLPPSCLAPLTMTSLSSAFTITPMRWPGTVQPCSWWRTPRRSQASTVTLACPWDHPSSGSARGGESTPTVHAVASCWSLTVTTADPGR